MAVLSKSTLLNLANNRSLWRALCASVLVVCVAVTAGKADEIRLKDGKKLYGVIVAYEDSMFKVKTDFGYVLVEKDKIASIIPTTPAAAKTESGTLSTETSAATDTNTGKKPATDKADKAAPKITNAAVRPELPAKIAPATSPAPTIKGTAPASTTALASTAAPAPPKIEPPANHEEIQGTVYVNHTYGFRMFKAPSWNLLDDARKALPNAIVALGTSNESTLLVIGEEKNKEPLEAAATNIEKRLHEVYGNYRQISRRKSVVGGLPAIEYRYRGMADEHDWSGRLVVIARGEDILTVLGMTYADSDLIQIQENVIARAIGSLDFGGTRASSTP